MAGLSRFSDGIQRSHARHAKDSLSFHAAHDWLSENQLAGFLAEVVFRARSELDRLVLPREGWSWDGSVCASRMHGIAIHDRLLEPHCHMPI